MANKKIALTRNHVEDVVAGDSCGVDPTGPRPGNEDSNNNVRVPSVQISNINDAACFVRTLTLMPQLMTVELIFT